MAPHPADFDRIARPYLWLEYATFGRALERCRFQYMDALADRRQALVLGDGDGRFAARLLGGNPSISVEAVDTSAVMLQLLAERVAHLGPAALERLQTWHGDALAFTPAVERRYDLIATHFFLDCLNEADIAALIAGIKPHLAPGAIWMVSEFAIPGRRPMASLSKAIIAALYRSFRLFTGLKARRLPGYGSQLHQSGFRLQCRKTHLCGLLVSEVWIFAPQ